MILEHLVESAAEVDHSEQGADAVMVFDTWGGSLTPADYREFSLRYMREIVNGLTREAVKEEMRFLVRAFLTGATAP